MFSATCALTASPTAGRWSLHRFACRFGLLRLWTVQRQPHKCLTEEAARFYASQVLLALEYAVHSFLRLPRRIGAHTLAHYSAHFCFGLIADRVAKSCRVWASLLVSHSCLRDIVVHGITNRQVLAHVRVHLPGPEAREHSDARVRAHHAHRLRPF